MIRTRTASVMAISVALSFLVAASPATAGDPNPYLIKDIAQPGQSVPFWLRVVGETLYFGTWSDDVAGGWELWKSDGTNAGTVRVKNVRPGPAGSEPMDLTPVGNRLFFVANDGTHGRELWVADGTNPGTHLVKDIHVGTEEPGQLTDVDGTLYFTAAGAGGRELWKSDGTPAGTRRVKDIRPGNRTSSPRALTAVGDLLYFTAKDGSGGPDLWVSDGTASGTEMVKDLVGRGDVGLGLTEVDGTLYFIGRNGATSRTLWTSDGTESGTHPLMQGVGAPSGVGHLTAWGSELIFTTDPADVKHSRDIWTSDGTAEGTQRVTHVDGYMGNDLRVTGDHVYYDIEDDDGHTSLWATDGTELGTVRVKAHGPYVYNTVAVGDLLYFPWGHRLWASDGTAAGTGPVSDPIAGTYMEDLTLVGDQILFAGDGGPGVEIELFGYDLP